MNKRYPLFSVSHGNRPEREKRIIAISEIEPSIGFLAAVFDFEWMVRRSILALSNVPSPFIRKHMKQMHGAEKLKEAWREFVCSVRSGIKYKTLVEVLNESVKWDDVTNAFKARHPIVHGANGFISDEKAQQYMHILLKASDTMERYLNSYGQTAFRRIDRRCWPIKNDNRVCKKRSSACDKTKKRSDVV